MPWTQKQMLRDANGDLIPQYWDVAEQEFKPLTGSDGANDVRITGSRGEYEVFFPRGIRTESEDVFVSVPKWAIGAIIQISVYGITGDMSNENDGVSLRVRNYAFQAHARHQFSDMETDKIKTTFSCTAIIYPTPSIPENTYFLSVPVVHDAILGNYLRLYANVEGTFGVDEGVDLEGNIQWLRR